jgi:hypothetical protein
MIESFRSDIPAPGDDVARRVYERATRGRRRRTRLLVALAVGALVLVPSTYAVARLFEGTPAPPDVSTTFTRFNQMADQLVQEGFHVKAAHADVAQAHGVIEIQTADGPEDLWAAPNDVGSICTFIDFANDPAGPDGKYGFSTCDDPSNRPPGDINWGDVWIAQDPDVLTIYGQVYSDAKTVTVTLDDGTTLQLPVIEHLFLASTTKDRKVRTVATG